MKIYCMSDIHGCLAEFEEALNLIVENLEEPDAQLVLLGDYIHGGPEGRRVLDKIMNLQMKYGTDKIIALMGNHLFYGKTTTYQQLLIMNCFLGNSK